ncbi:VOC family protein [Methanosphaerula palustris]|uniref:3-demethylubiquinone-9 3-methyltransferase n=1 Tax=Methanosphaerula palustris (strain ATCC BAA-1556 / DSM 19958 / E1-9c) TaxID=521011 RepID=B8GIK2_METPE|nr:VOC family protein [Methanosphaerula palustris]ACL16815.1 3-demethylubiquinone-9 3-methyltransferase [Methanosphaerula palustris E1-9c]
MERIVLSLMFRDNAEEAVKFYLSLFSPIFGNSKIEWITYYGEEELEALRAVPQMSEEIMPGPAASVKTVRFRLAGQEILAVNGGGFFGKFTESASLYVSCETQEQIDLLWTALSREGTEQPCGWVKDRFGVSWQIAPSVIGEIMEGPDQKKAQRVMLALYRMKKIDLEEILRAAAEPRPAGS